MKLHLRKDHKPPVILLTVVACYGYMVIVLLLLRWMVGDYPIFSMYLRQLPLPQMYPFQFIAAIACMLWVTLQLYTRLTEGKRLPVLCLLLPWLSLLISCYDYLDEVWGFSSKTVPMLLLCFSFLSWLVIRWWKPGYRWIEYFCLYTFWIIFFYQKPGWLFYVFPYLLLPLLYTLMAKHKKYETFLRYASLYVTWISLSCLAGGFTGSFIRWGFLYGNIIATPEHSFWLLLEDIRKGYSYGMQPIALSFLYNIPVLTGTFYMIRKSKLLQHN